MVLSNGLGEALVIDRRAIHIKAEINYAAALYFHCRWKRLALNNVI
jgi:hypothetical protein